MPKEKRQLYLEKDLTILFGVFGIQNFNILLSFNPLENLNW
jgi:hypothetical protein